MTTYSKTLPASAASTRTTTVLSRVSPEGYEYEVEVEVLGSVEPYIPARTWGHPDSWYPAEGGEAEVHGAYMQRHGCWVEVELTSEETRELEGLLSDTAESEPDYGPDPDDCRDEYMDL